MDADPLAEKGKAKNEWPISLILLGPDGGLRSSRRYLGRRALGRGGRVVGLRSDVAVIVAAAVVLVVLVVVLIDGSSHGVLSQLSLL